MSSENQKKTSAKNSKEPIFFYILIRSWNSYEYFDQCVNSVLSQNYSHYQILFVDDCSNYTAAQKKHIKQKLKGHIIRWNRTRKFAVRNAYELLTCYATDNEAVVVSLDGDDWLNSPTVLTTISQIYQKNDCYFTYGNCAIWTGQRLSPVRDFDSLANSKYPSSVVNASTFRQEPFRPLHLRTWKVWLFKQIKKEDFFQAPRIWFRFCEDMVIFFPFLEMAYHQCCVLTEPLVVYNRSTVHSDIKANTIATIREEIIIRKKDHYGRIE